MYDNVLGSVQGRLGVLHATIPTPCPGPNHREFEEAKLRRWSHIPEISQEVHATISELCPGRTMEEFKAVTVIDQGQINYNLLFAA